jgi:hypothetical protein
MFCPIIIRKIAQKTEIETKLKVESKLVLMRANFKA